MNGGEGTELTAVNTTDVEQADDICTQEASRESPQNVGFLFLLIVLYR